MKAMLDILLKMDYLVISLNGPPKFSKAAMAQAMEFETV